MVVTVAGVSYAYVLVIFGTFYLLAVLNLKLSASYNVYGLTAVWSNWQYASASNTNKYLSSCWSFFRVAINHRIQKIIIHISVPLSIAVQVKEVINGK
jgi:hypothetical protein